MELLVIVVVAAAIFVITLVLIPLGAIAMYLYLLFMSRIIDRIWPKLDEWSERALAGIGLGKDESRL